MIAQRIDKKAGKADFGTLANYICREEAGDGEVPPVSFLDNCDADSVELAKIEIAVTQSMNTRAKSDKSYHLVVSFDKQDQVNDETMFEISKKLCEKIGYKDHQKILAIHKNTDYPHCHIAINKINPISLKIHEPYYDKFILNEISAELEKEYGLVEINHSNDEISSNKNNKQERYRGVKPFKEWVLEACREDVNTLIEEGGDWKKLQVYLAKNNLEIRKRGAGLVVSDKDRKLFIKASLLSRKLKSLGEFVKYDIAVEPEQKYIEAPLTPNKVLWAEFQEIKKSRVEKRKAIKHFFYLENKKLLESVRSEKALLKSSKKISRKDRKRFYAEIKAKSDKNKNELRVLKDKQLAEYVNINWTDFLVNKYVQEASYEALNILKGTKYFKNLQSNIQVQGEAKKETVNPLPNVDLKGIPYKDVGKDKINENENSLSTDSGNLNVISELLDLAKERFDEPLTVTGGDKFIQKVELVASIKGIKLKNTVEVVKAQEKQEMALLSKLVQHGKAPYKGDIKNSESYFAVLENMEGIKKVYWGMGIEDALLDAGAKTGDYIKLEKSTKKDVVGRVPTKEKGKNVSNKKIEKHRNKWEVSIQKSSESDKDISL